MDPDQDPQHCFEQFHFFGLSWDSNEVSTGGLFLVYCLYFSSLKTAVLVSSIDFKFSPLVNTYKFKNLS